MKNKEYRMKKIITALALVSSLSLANDYPIQFGFGYAPGNNNGDVITGFASVGVFGGIATRFEYVGNLTDGDLFSAEDMTRYALFAVYDLEVTPYISLTPKMGIVKNDSTVTVNNAVGSISGSSTEFTYGLEVNYSYSDRMNLYLGYTDYGNGFDFKTEHFDSDYMDSANFSFGVKYGL
jgi:hypothetical protein